MDIYAIVTAFAWVKCEREEDEDCYQVLKEFNITGRAGNLFGAERRYVRLSMVKSNDDFDLLLKQINKMVSQETHNNNNDDDIIIVSGNGTRKGDDSNMSAAIIVINRVWKYVKFQRILLLLLFPFRYVYLLCTTGFPLYFHFVRQSLMLL